MISACLDANKFAIKFDDMFSVFSFPHMIGEKQKKKSLKSGLIEAQAIL